MKRGLEMKSSALLIGFALILAGCQSRVAVNSYPFYETTIDKLPHLEEVRGILVMMYNHPSVPCYVLAIGDRREIEKIVGYPLADPNGEGTRVVQDAEWITRIYKALANSERWDRYCDDDARIAFVTPSGAYMVGICDHDDFVYGTGYRSPELKTSLDELGIPGN